MASLLVLKVGSQPGETGFKEGMPVSLLPDDTHLSETMKRVYAIVRLTPRLVRQVRHAFRPLRDGTIERQRSAYFDLRKLGNRLHDDRLLERWRSQEAVPVQEAMRVNRLDDLLLPSTTGSWVEQDWNIHNSGSWTVGSGGTFPDWATAQADIGNLTGALTYTQISACTSAPIGAVIAVNLGVYKLTLTSNTPHSGDPTAGWITTMGAAANGYGIGIRPTGGSVAATLEISHLNLHATFSVGYWVHGITVQPQSAQVQVHDSIVLINGNNTNNYCFELTVYSGSASYQMSAWNNVAVITNANTSATGIYAYGGYSNPVVVENCSSYTSNARSFSGGALLTIRNCVGISGGMGTAFYSIGSSIGRNNASSNASAADGNWQSGSGNRINIVSSNEFVSLLVTSPDLFKVRDDGGGVCYNNGIATTIGTNTVGIRGNARPGVDGLYSIGADELLAAAPPVPTSCTPNSGTTAGGTPVTIGGSDFVAGATVDFDGIPATDVVVVSAVSITCVTPAHAAGAVDIVVTNPDLLDGTLAGGYTYIVPPTIDTQPTDQTVVAGETATFQVVATGADTYQWQELDGIWSDLVGETTDSLAIATVPADDGRQFRVVVANGGGSVNSNTVTLHVTTTRPGIQDRQIQLDVSSHGGLFALTDKTLHDFVPRVTANLRKSNFAAVSSPTVNDDAAAGYAIGSEWYDTINDIWWKCESAAVGAAVWEKGMGGGIDQLQTIYVGKHGSDAADGKTPDKAKLTIGAAITAAGAPANEAAAVCVKIVDDGSYTESFALPSYVNLDGPAARIVGTVTLNDNSAASVRMIEPASGTGCVSKASGSGTAYMRAGIIRATGAGTAAAVTAGKLVLVADEVTSAGSAITVTGAGVEVDATIGRLVAVGAAYNIGAGAVFRMFVNVLSGTETAADGADVRVVRARRDNYAATADPAVTDDANDGYAAGSQWLNTVTRVEFVCVSATAGAAVWQPLPAGVTRVQTTNATLTTAVTIPLASSEAVLVDVLITARRTAASGHAAYHRKALAYRYGGGSATLVDLVDTPLTRETDNTWDATISVSGNNLLIQVQGAAGQTVEWRVRYQLERM